MNQPDYTISYVDADEPDTQPSETPTDDTPAESESPKVAIIGDGGREALNAALARLGAPEAIQETAPMPPMLSEPMQYEVENTDGSKELVTMGPSSNIEAPDPIGRAQKRLHQLQAVHRYIKMQKRAAKNAEKRARKLSKRRAKRDQAKASRKRNR